MRFYLLLSSLVLFPALSRAQGNIADSSLFITHVRISYGAYLPGGHLVDRFGWNSALGFCTDVKFKSNWVVGLSGRFIFGNQVKENTIASLQNSEGFIIDMNGNYATVLTSQRGFTIHATGGYLIPRLGPNPNSGILLQGGIGFLQHKIRIEHDQSPVPALEGEYLKGYDRLTNGLLLTEFIGYQYLSNKRLLNFYAGIELMQGFTRNRRSYNFDTMQADRTARMDLFFGLRAGWILPLYARAPKAYYY